MYISTFGNADRSGENLRLITHKGVQRNWFMWATSVCVAKRGIMSKMFSTFQQMLVLVRQFPVEWCAEMQQNIEKGINLTWATVDQWSVRFLYLHAYAFTMSYLYISYSIYSVYRYVYTHIYILY